MGSCDLLFAYLRNICLSQLPEPSTPADSLQCTCSNRQGERFPPFSPSTLTLPRQEWGLLAKPPAFNLLTLFLEVKLTRACCHPPPPRLEKLLGLLFRMGLHLETVGSQSKNLIYVLGKCKQLNSPLGQEQKEFQSVSLLPGSRNPGSKNKKEWKKKKWLLFF